MEDSDFKEGITEVLEILNYMGKKYIDKIPKKFIEFMENNKSDYYVPKLDYSKKISEMSLKRKTKAILATIYMNYWTTPEEKINYVKTLKENELKYQEEIRKKYNPDDIFKKRKMRKDNANNGIGIMT